MVTYRANSDGHLLEFRCNGETNVEIPAGVTRIGPAFYSSGIFENRFNNQVESVVIPEGVTAIGTNTFRNCEKLKRVVLPSTLETIESQAFQGCRSLEEVVFPETLRNICAYAFFGCSALKRIALPAGLTSIAEMAFAHTGLEEVTGLHEGIRLENGAFSRCIGLADADGFVILNNILFHCTVNAEHVTIPADVQQISSAVFIEQEQLKSVTIHDGVKQIGANQFAACKALTDVRLPEGLEEIPYACFRGCTSLVSITIPDSVKKIHVDGFWGCTALKELHLPAQLVEIDRNAFHGCTELEEVQIPDSVKTLQGFMECPKLAKMNMPAKLKRISNLEGCKLLSVLLLPKGVEYPWDSFRKDLLIIPGDVYADAAETKNGKPWDNSTVLFTVGDKNQTALRIVLNSKFEKLQCYGKKTGFQWKVYDGLLVNNEAKLPSALLALAMLCRLRWDQELSEDKRQFFAEYVTKNLKKVAPYVNLFPEDGLIGVLETIGALTERNKKTILPLMGIGEAPAPKTDKKPAKAAENGVKTPAQLKKEWNIKKLDDGTLRLTSYKGTDTVVEVPAMIGNDKVTVIGNECLTCSIYSRATKEQVAHRQKITAVVIPEGITEIGEDAFFKCENLASVTLPTSLKSVGRRAFGHCTTLKNVVLPPDATLENAAFFGCKSMADENGLVIVGGVLYNCYTGGDVVLPETVKALEDHAFNYMDNLTSVTFPQGLKKIPSWAIYNCKNLKSVTIPPSVKEIGGSAFDGNPTIRGYTGSEAEAFAKRNFRMKFESIGVLVEEHTDFVIEDDMLKEYKGKDTVVTIPEGVTVIGGYKVSSYSTRGAFAGKNVEKVVIPAGVRGIWGRAFSDCKALREIEIPDTVELVGNRAFSGTAWLNDQPMGPVYAGRALCAYKTTGDIQVDPDTLIVREGTKSITDETFWYQRNLKKVILPQGLEHIGSQAFCGCSELKEMVVPASVTEVGDGAFDQVSLQRCSGGVLHKTTKLPARFKVFYTGDPEDTAWVNLYQGEPAWRKAIRERVDADPDSVDPALIKMAEMIHAMPALDKSVGNRAASFAQELYAAAGAEALKAIYDALKAKNHPAVKKLDLDEGFRAAMEGTAQEDLSLLHPVEAKVVQNVKPTPAFNKVLNRIVEGVPYAGSQELCAPRVVAFVAYEYIRQYDPESVRYVSEYATACTAYAYSAVADEVAAALDQNAFQEALLRLAQQFEGEYYLPYARYADDKHTVALLSQMREWDNWNRYAATGRKNIIIARSGLLLNDTKAAMIHMDKVGCLGTYAALRGTDAETLRDTVLADFGFDENQEIRYDLGGNTIIVRMDNALNLTLFDTNAGKIVKSVPKKGADAALHEQAKSAFSDLKKNIKKVITNRKHLLFADFLSGAEKAAERWKRSYIGNPVLNSVARLVVWEQGGKTFTLTLDGAVDSAGNAYGITDAPIKVAHPMEMQPEIAAWQEYFTSNGLKQPFEQIWEPAYNAADIKPDRYDGCSLNVYRLANKEQHGIYVWGLQAYSEDYGFKLTDCQMEQSGSEWRFINGITDDATFSLGKFTFTNFTRYVNHIVYMFDKWTITERLLKDDVSVQPLLVSFTAAQIREFIGLATEKGCTNAAAMLLNYQNEHFSAFDPLAEFTLDL